MINQTLNKRYPITARLGKGAMGTVYRATDIQTGQDVALKVLAADLTFDPEMLERFRREGEALRQLRHPNIVGFVDMFEHESQQVIVMEYISGGSLYQLIRQGLLPVDQIRRMALELCDALTRAHHLNIIHRDIKPENILLAADGAPRLTDLGVARLVGEGTRLTGTGTQVGTPFYMSPEAWQGQSLDARADIWSLGIVIYEMVSGQVPFGGETMAAVMNKVLTAPLPDLKALRPDTPPELAKIVRKMLTRDRAKRYQTMREVALDLERVNPEEGSRTIKGATTKREAASPREEKQKTKIDRARPGRVVAVIAVIAGLLVIGGIAAAIGASGWALNYAAIPGRARQTLPGADQHATSAALTLAVVPSQTAPPSTPPQPSAMPLTSTGVPSQDASPLPADLMPPTNAKLGDTWTSPMDGMTLVYIPAGEFIMGSTPSEPDAGTIETPQHTVYLDAYWIDKTDVTNAMYAKCVQARWCPSPNSLTSPTRDSYYGNAAFDNYPVIWVRWDDAKAYCRWAGRHLPTEAEWEKAARGTSGYRYPWGNQAPNNALLNFNREVDDTTEVGHYPAGASPYGALDMAGNVWQWVGDWYDANYYASSPNQNPTGPATGTDHVLRGGSWNSAARNVRTARRYWNPANGRYHDVGFRCVR